jgi:glutaredoxin
MRRFIVPLILLLPVIGCSKSPKSAAPASKNSAAQEDSALPPKITITATRSDVVYSYRTGLRFLTANSIDKIPAEARAQVIVTDLSLTPAQRQSGKYVYLADLRKPRDGGEYPVSIASRYGLEAELSKARSSSVSAQVQGDGVVVYSTSWCGVCKKAMKLLNRWGVAYVEKDIEGSRKAKSELAAKSQAAGIQPGGVPVIDVGGILLQGLDEATLKSALQSKGFL